MRDRWRVTLGTGIVIASLAIPLMAQGSTQAEFMQKSQLHRTQTGKQVTKADDRATKAQLEKKKALRAEGRELFKARRALAKQHNKSALKANSAKMAAVEAALDNGGAN